MSATEKLEAENARLRTAVATAIRVQTVLCADILEDVEALALERDLLAEKLNAREVQAERLHAYVKALRELVDDLLTCQHMLRGEIESGVTWRNVNQMDVCFECPIQCNVERPSLKSRAEDLGVSFR